MEKPALHPKTNASLLVGLERRRSAGDVLELDPQHAYPGRPHRWTSDMKRKCILEISVQTVEAALAAERGGADRIELCSDLSRGGVTPGAGLVSTVQKQILIPIVVMIRPRGGDFVYSTAEFAEMKRAISAVKECGLDGVVLGILRKDRQVDIQRTRELFELAGPLPVTYRRAFDKAPDQRRAHEEVIETSASRILTSGGANSALEDRQTIRLNSSPLV